MHRPLVSALGRWRQVDLCEFKATLDYIASSRPVGATQWGVGVEVVVGYLAGQK